MSLRRLEKRPKPGAELCRLDEIDPDLGTARFLWHEWDGPYRLVLIRRGDAVYAYRNQCPHALAYLDHPPGNFFTEDRKYLECAFHGAQFRISDGHCVTGPCYGQALTAFPIRIADGVISVAEAPAKKKAKRRARA